MTIKGKTIIILIVILLGSAISYWYFLLRYSMNTIPINTDTEETGGFAPFGRTSSGGRQGTSGGENATTTNYSGQNEQVRLPVLRLLSDTPIGGYGASTTASTTVIRWIDRGRGNTYEARQDSLNIRTLSNTILPRVYQSSWNKNLTAFIGTIFPDNSGDPSVVYAELQAHPIPKQQATTTATSTPTAPANNSLAPFDLKGKNLPEKTIAYAVSPKKDRLFVFVDENGSGTGYISNFNGSSLKKIFSSPLTQVNVDWPEENTIAITTKGSSNQNGFLYFVNPNTGIIKKILGPIRGLSTRVSHDARYVLYSTALISKNSIRAFIYSITSASETDALIQTLADKCAWGHFYAYTVYCAAPSSLIQAEYPDDWYKGTVSFTDKIWAVDARTGEVSLVSALVDQADRLIDVFNMEISDKDEYLLFMNKKDLSFWSLDLVSSK
ncbi:MAG: hypothetical protein A3B11_00590 [Candidatus Taylorbacteria bacterium RIFCSPLOWO2_01_FULL_44_26]|uniref:Uncharacterized protein n=2 Tax=Candidatus Tayloriibacteriota TaxID=1817919 RepID=A0A1G2ML56_9BACT|nr:MAG: hypothetical protein A3D50_00505 [Candidatus Taylorbacteria bacterium RIFCSPHIGHO2_02_FULL_44_12]OHA31182.1 MAG: hypothetical protein A3B11_00590 [Candidatus Taylorbacteria bacterium RIFCSPLOWO2_01_FULL_44_26]